MGAAFAVALGLALIVLAVAGTGEDGLVAALRVTARWSFLLFWIAYCARAIGKLSGPALARLGRRGREFGLAYAAAHLIHLGLVVWLFHIAPRPPISNRLIVFFSIGIFWTYLLAFLSFGNLADALGPRGWRAVRLVGMNYLLFAFGFDFVRPLLHLESAQYPISRFAEYAPFAAMSLAAPLLVIAAAAQTRLHIRYTRATVGHAAD
jgi:hypothetical protein